MFKTRSADARFFIELHKKVHMLLFCFNIPKGIPLFCFVVVDVVEEKVVEMEDFSSSLLSKLNAHSTAEAEELFKSGSTELIIPEGSLPEGNTPEDDTPEGVDKDTMPKGTDPVIPKGNTPEGITLVGKTKDDGTPIGEPSEDVDKISNSEELEIVLPEGSPPEGETPEGVDKDCMSEFLRI